MVKDHSVIERENPLQPLYRLLFPTRSCHVRVFKRAHSEQAVVAHACHGHKYRPSPVPLSGTGKKRGEGVRGGGGACTGGYKRVQAVRPGSVAGGGCLRCYGILNVP